MKFLIEKKINIYCDFNDFPEFKNLPKIVHLPKELNGQQMPMSKRRSMKSQNSNDEDEKEVPQKHPQKKIAYKIRGHMREYHFLKTVKSMEELDKFRFKVIQKRMEQF
jgi:hypothetical protein